MNAKLAEQAENIKFSYQATKDMDLTHAYDQQQQKMFDIYMQPSSSDTSNIHEENPSALHTFANRQTDKQRLIIIL
ncbi:hypothetical protein [Candidatus Colwellia aromaticivorans]|uniref:hypothetical protein n=1 Tax=Candidatus Colwellia aromaticivorans TaxID=2267621 RepID=UPI000DF4BD72|nr:hypothetical protein [Candidatus Colwellia aromaticivorans]